MSIDKNARRGAYLLASAHPLATKAGMEILDAGGNAFDAAVAVSAALSVVEPYSSGIGGGGLWLLHRSSDGLKALKVSWTYTARPQPSHQKAGRIASGSADAIK